MSNEAPQSVSLFFKQGSSDKQYDIFLEETDGGWIVKYANGRRGSTMKPGLKTQEPIDYAGARKIYDKLMKDKMAKGYTPNGEGTPFSMTAKNAEVSDFVPQLLNFIPESEIERYLTDNNYVMQEKHDGERRAIKRMGDEINGINKKGLYVPLKSHFVEEVGFIKDSNRDNNSLLIDGEEVGDDFFAFDLLDLSGYSLKLNPYDGRLELLEDLLHRRANADLSPRIKIVKSYWTTAEKRKAFETLRANKSEGVVFKYRHAEYNPGRPSSGGDQVKFKFYKTLSAIVSGINQKRSVAIEVMDGDKRVQIGSVTIPANHYVPTIGQVIEVRYLYAYKGGSLYQPTYLCKREDVTPDECGIHQVQYRAEP